MRPPVGSSLKVSGIRMAVPAAGPSPGRTPISVPRMQPINANARFCQLMAAARPVIRCCNVSTASVPIAKFVALCGALGTNFAI